jgi:hypothetical protein
VQKLSQKIFRTFEDSIVHFHFNEMNFHTFFAIVVREIFMVHDEKLSLVEVIFIKFTTVETSLKTFQIKFINMATRGGG